MPTPGNFLVVIIGYGSRASFYFSLQIGHRLIALSSWDFVDIFLASFYREGWLHRAARLLMPTYMLKFLGV